MQIGMMRFLNLRMSLILSPKALFLISEIATVV